MTKNHNDCLKNLEQDIIYFLNMCTKEDEKLFISNPKDKKIEDCGRFICLGLAFNMRGVFLSVFSQCEEIGDADNILAYMKTITFEQTKKWVEEFLEKIANSVLKKTAQSIWEEKKEYFCTHKFELSELL